MVSIIVFSFDGNEQLSQCVKAIKSATFESHEVLEAPSQSPRGRTLTLPEALNRAASSAQGEYLAFLTADTVLSPGWLERLIACAEHRSRCRRPALQHGDGPAECAACREPVPPSRQTLPNGGPR